MAFLVAHAFDVAVEQIVLVGEALEISFYGGELRIFSDELGHVAVHVVAEVDAVVVNGAVPAPARLYRVVEYYFI
jgi:hypothetical protein